MSELKRRARPPRSALTLIALAVIGAASCSHDTTAPPPPPPTNYQLRIVSGSGQTDTIGAHLPQPLVVRVVAPSGGTALGQVVRFAVAEGNGVVSADSVITSADGIAQVTWTLGSDEGARTVHATLRATTLIDVTFSATATLPVLHAVAITTGYTHSCAITAAHRLYCWGGNDEGQLGDGTTTGRNVASVSVGTLDFARVAAGGSHTCALTTNGELYCWGRNVWGQVGDGSTVQRLSPSRVAPTLTFVDVFAGDETTCALTAAGDVYCWGFMEATSASAPYYLPAKVSGTIQFKSLNVSLYAVCGVATDNTAYCMRPTFVPDGLGGGPGTLWRPQLAPPPGTFTTFAGGILSDCGLDLSAHALCFGGNQYGTLGVGDTLERADAVFVDGDREFTAIYAGYDWTCGTTSAGETYCWGHNDWGELGQVTDEHYIETTPRLLVVPAGLSFTAMDGGFYHMCGIGTDSQVYCWGAGFNGQLGDEHSIDNFYQTSIPGPVRRK
jgi:alpha-tubulin suppressor-like RCC1 family protein